MAAGAVAVIVELLGYQRGTPIRYTCADGATIPKGSLLKITDPRTVVAATADNDPFGGIAAMTKLSGDGSTTITAYTNGIFMIEGKAAVTTGERVSCAADGNKVSKVVADSDNLFSDVGIALGACSGDGVAFPVLIGSGF